MKTKKRMHGDNLTCSIRKGKKAIPVDNKALCFADRFILIENSGSYASSFD